MTSPTPRDDWQLPAEIDGRQPRKVRSLGEIRATLKSIHNAVPQVMEGPLTAEDLLRMKLAEAQSDARHAAFARKLELAAEDRQQRAQSWKQLRRNYRPNPHGSPAVVLEVSLTLILLTALPVLAFQLIVGSGLASAALHAATSLTIGLAVFALVFGLRRRALDN